MLIVDTKKTPIAAGSTVYFTATMKTIGGVNQTPLSVQRKVIDVTDGVEEGTVIADWSTISTGISGAVVTHSTVPSENMLLKPHENATEKRRLLLKANFGFGDDWIDYVEYTISRVDVPV